MTTSNGALTTTNQSQTQINLGLGTMCSVTVPIPVANGGTGNTSFTANQLILGNGTSALINQSIGTNGQLYVGVTSGQPSWATATSSTGSVTFTIGAGSIKFVLATATTSQLGGSVLATSAQTVTGTNATSLVVPSGLLARFQAPGAIGGTTPGTGTFTSITLTSGAGPTLKTGSGAASGAGVQGSLFLRTDGTTTNNRGYINTNGASTWTSFVTVG